MGRKPPRNMLEWTLGSRARAQILRALFRGPEHRPWLRQLARHAGGFSGVYRELRYWRACGLIRPKREGGAQFWEVDMQHPLALPMRDFIQAIEAWDRGELGNEKPDPITWERVRL